MATWRLPNELAPDSILGCITVLCDAGLCFRGELLVGGSLKALNLYYDNNVDRQRGLLSAETFRLDFTGSKGKSSFELSLEQKILWASRPAGRIADNSVNRVFDLENTSMKMKIERVDPG